MKRQLLLFILFSLISYTCLPQAYTVKTIFEYLQVKDNKVPVMTTIPESVRSEDEKEMVSNRPYSGEKQDAKTLLASLEKMQAYLGGKHSLPRLGIEEFLFFMPGPGGVYNMYFDGKECVLRNKNGEEKLRGDFFCTIYDNQPYLGFNSYNKTGRADYYDGNAGLFFKDKFQHTEKTHENYYHVHDGNKWGIADSSGKVLLPARYDKSFGFRFNNKNWFSIEENGNIFFMEEGNDTRILKNSRTYIPHIIADRYWIIDGKVFDMISRVQLFVNVDKRIRQDSWDQPVFYIEEQYETGLPESGSNWKKGTQTKKIFFDQTGKLLLGSPVINEREIDNLFRIVSVKSRDTIIRGLPFVIQSYGVINNEYKWQFTPVYRFIDTVDNKTLRLYPAETTGKPTLCNIDGKPLLPALKYDYYSKGYREGEYLCYSMNGSDLWNVHNNSFTPLDKNYIYFTSSETADFGCIAASAGKKMFYLLDSNYKVLDTTAYFYLNGRGTNNLLACTPYSYSGQTSYADERFYFNTSMQRISFNFEGKTYDRFRYIDSIAAGSYLYKFEKGPNILQVSPGQYFYTEGDYAKYDPAFEWFVMQDKKNSWGIMSRKGEVLVPFVFGRIGTYSAYNGCVSFTDKSGNIHAVDKKGQLIFGDQYDMVRPLVPGSFIVKKDGLSGVVTREGKEKIAVKYPYLEIKYGCIWYGTDQQSAKQMPIGLLRN